MNSSGSAPAALVVAHPGHELRVYHWMERMRPLVCVLTDGSGAGGRPRIASTVEVLRRAGADAGPIFGRFSDRAMYDVVLDGDLDAVVALVRELERLLLGRAITVVAGDAMEGYNPTHDLCRLIVDCACARVSRRRARVIDNLEFSLLADPRESSRSDHEETVTVTLDDAALERKVLAANGYAELRGEIDQAVGAFGRDAFRREHLGRASGAHPDWVKQPPLYEGYGEKRAAQGVYPRVLRYRQHLLPIEHALAELAGRDG